MKIILPARHPIFRCASEMRQICSPLKSHFNIEHYSYLKIYSDSTRVHLTTTPVWSEHFYKHAFQYHKNEEADIYTDVETGILTNANLQEKQEGRDSIDKGLGERLIFFKKHADFCEIFFMALSSEDKYSQLNYEALLRSIDQLDIFNHHFCSVAAGLVANAEKQKISLPSLQSKKYKPPISSFKNQDFLQDILKDRFNFTPRELDCIKLLLSGSNPQRISRNLNISQKTLEKHLCSLREKSGASSTIDLIHIVRRYF